MMPGRRPIPQLGYLCSRGISQVILDTLVSLEKEGNLVKDGHFRQYNNSATFEQQKQLEEKQKLELLTWQKKYLPLLNHLQSSPSRLIEKINLSILETFVQRYLEIKDAALAVWVLTKGVTAVDFYQKINPNPILYDSSWSSINIPTLDSVLNLMVQPSLTVLDLSKLATIGSVSENVFKEFNSRLSNILPKVPYLLSLILPSHNNVTTSLPQVTNDHLNLIGQHCPHLLFLDISFNRKATSEGLKHLLPRTDSDIDHPGCVKIRKLYIFDCGMFEREVAKVVSGLPDLAYLGYKETGKVIKTLHKAVLGGKELKELGIHHVDNMGSKSRRLIASALRCKKQLTQSISVMCPRVRNLKVRVADEDVASLESLEHLETVELVYHVGTLHSPGSATHHFLQVRGGQLTSVALTCNTMTMNTLVAIAESCPGLSQLWLRSNHLTTPESTTPVSLHHGYLCNLRTLSFRVGQDELQIQHLPEFILPYLLKNSHNLKELIIAVRTATITDAYLYQLLTEFDLNQLEKIVIVVPGTNSVKGTIALSNTSLEYLLFFCPNLTKIGNLLSWKVEEKEIEDLQEMIREHNYQLEVLNKKMIFR